MLKRYRDGVLPRAGALSDTERDLVQVTKQSIETYRQGMGVLSYATALEGVWQLIRRANRYVDETAPWKLAKDPAMAERLDTVLNHLIQTAGVLANVLSPVMPTIAGQIAEQLAAPHLVQPGLDLNEPLKAGHGVGNPSPLFPRQVTDKK